MDVDIDIDGKDEYKDASEDDDGSELYVLFFLIVMLL